MIFSLNRPESQYRERYANQVGRMTPSLSGGESEVNHLDDFDLMKVRHEIHWKERKNGEGTTHRVSQTTSVLVF